MRKNNSCELKDPALPGAASWRKGEEDIDLLMLAYTQKRAWIRPDEKGLLLSRIATMICPLPDGGKYQHLHQLRSMMGKRSQC
jgi:hypothetical protein